ncbi:lactate permease [Tessaracoccus lapidicaptus]|uniref:L-lactate permease n=1 Tax=Tessaracoccus lapidicaptus TaxID=1427523 RepID=A0A1C0AKB5_9ACTN|nr:MULTISPECIES: L-lactate permease [Tessaracoccus]AQX14544.1 lactate permease [Tessaracoccus sp. T2.5-30]OCL32943.1 lactate permease [Tessaracoccus lapidicaptus]VEP38562.1 Glycolate permease GlcA [Tessaracoccus lapidicaptus]
MTPLEVFTPDINPLGAQWLSALVGLIPIVTMMVTLAVLRWKAHWAGLFSTAVAIVIAVVAFRMPFGLAVNSGVEGFFFGLFPIIWIVIAAIWFYQITVVSGRFNDLRDTFNLISDDPRVQAILIAFCFGGLLEALAGFGAPVAITGVMLMAIGFPAFRAAMVVLLANTAPVAFGAVAIPIITAGNLTGIDYREIGAYVGHQTPILAFFVPFLLLLLADGIRGLKEVWPVAMAIGAGFAVTQWISATYISVELTDVIASLVGLGVGVLVLKVWQPKGGHAALERMRAEVAASGAADITGAHDEHSRDRGPLTPRHIAMALLPYVLVIIIFSVAKLVPPVTKALTSTDVKFGWPGLYGNVLNSAGEPVSSTMFNFNWLSNPGTLLAITAILVALIYRVSARDTWGELRNTVVKMRWSILTVGSVLALAYVLNLSGQTIAVGTWIAGTGAAFAFLSPTLGWIGTAITGSDTSANALFAKLQQTAGAAAGLDQTLLVAANTSGGVVGKMISPQNLAIACSAVGIVGQESALLRKVVWWSLGMLAALCLLIGLQSTPILSWMLP